MNLMKLKSGTDVRGTALNPDEPEKIDLTDETVLRIAASFAEFLSKKTGKPTDALAVSVGHDSRVSAERIKKQVISALLAKGVGVKDCSLCSTPAMFMTTKLLGCDGAVQITASHHPWDRNGLKFFTSEGGISGGELSGILEYAETHGVRPQGENGAVQAVSFMENYCARLRALIKEGVKAEDYERPLKGLKIVVDAGNGVGGFYAKSVLEPLGADTGGSRYLEPDGTFPNHVPNPENEKAMESIREATLESGAELGVIFDTDVDRAACVSADGREINRSRLVALAAALALENCRGGTIVTDSVTSAGLTEFIEKTLGGKHRRFKRGYRNVIDEAVRLEREGTPAPLAIETSGHAAFRENYFLDDGAYLIARLVIKAAEMKKKGGALTDLIRDLKEPAEEAELRLSIGEAAYREYGAKVIAFIEERARGDKAWKLAQDSFEGVKVCFDDEGAKGFFILRQSVHDPVLPVHIESETEGGVREIARRLYGVLEGCGGLDLLALRQIL